jgi:ABC-2 type transport system ATP-binding protein
MDNPMAIIEVKELCKSFKVPVPKEGRFAAVRNLFSFERTEKTAVDCVSFDVDRGEMMGYVGPNGAGKSTTIKMLTGILLPTSGEVEVDGLVPHRDRKQLARRIGVVFGQKSQLWWDVPVIESLRLLKEIYRIPTRTYKTNMEMFKELLDLDEFQDTPVRQLSLGQRMRSDLAAALLHDPEILFLDEPTIGVDVVAKERFRTFIRQLNRERKVTVLLTTHDMSDIEKICESLLIIDHGRIIYDGTVAGIKEEYAHHRDLIVDFSDSVLEIESDRAEIIEREDQRVRLRFNRNQVSASELITELVGKYQVRDISVEEPEIEEIVRKIYEGSPIESGPIEA